MLLKLHLLQPSLPCTNIYNFLSFIICSLYLRMWYKYSGTKTLGRSFWIGAVPLLGLSVPFPFAWGWARVNSDTQLSAGCPRVGSEARSACAGDFLFTSPVCGHLRTRQVGGVLCTLFKVLYIYIINFIYLNGPFQIRVGRARSVAGRPRTALCQPSRRHPRNCSCWWPSLPAWLIR